MHSPGRAAGENLNLPVVQQPIALKIDKFLKLFVFFIVQHRSNSFTSAVRSEATFPFSSFNSIIGCFGILSEVC